MDLSVSKNGTDTHLLGHWGRELSLSAVGPAFEVLPTPLVVRYGEGMELVDYHKIVRS